jgi:putative aminopeptidase FrvX
MVNLLIPLGIIALIWYLNTIIHFIFLVLNNQPLIQLDSSIWNVFTTPDWIFLGVIITLPYVSWVGLRMVSSLPIPGANDNLSGVAVVMMVLKHFAANPQARPKNLEIWFVAFGSEEGGMMGSKAMAEEVKEALTKGLLSTNDVWVLNFDSIGANGPLTIATKESMYRVKSHNPLVYNQLAQSAKKANIDHIVKSIPAGTDSAPFSRLGIPAGAILCFGDGTSPPNWHSRDDIPENVDERGLRNSIKLTLQFIQDIDESFSDERKN